MPPKTVRGCSSRGAAVRASNLYEYDFDAAAGQRVVKVTGGDGTVSVPAPELRGVVQVSPDGSHVYFVAGGVLTTHGTMRG